MMDLMPENLFLDQLGDPSQNCCLFSSLCRFCRNTKTKCYLQERGFVGWCNFYLKLGGSEIDSLPQLWDWTVFLALIDGLSREKQLLDADSVGSETEIRENWDIVQEYLIKENVVKSVITSGEYDRNSLTTKLCYTILKLQEI